MDKQGLKGRLFGVSFLQRAATTRAKKPSKALDSTILRMHEVQVSLVCLASAAGREEIPHRNTPLLREQHKHSMDYGKEREGEEPGAKAHLCTFASGCLRGAGTRTAKWENFGLAAFSFEQSKKASLSA